MLIMQYPSMDLAICIPANAGKLRLGSGLVEGLDAAAVDHQGLTGNPV